MPTDLVQRHIHPSARLHPQRCRQLGRGTIALVSDRLAQLTHQPTARGASGVDRCRSAHVARLERPSHAQLSPHLFVQKRLHQRHQRLICRGARARQRQAGREG